MKRRTLLTGAIATFAIALFADQAEGKTRRRQRRPRRIRQQRQPPAIAQKQPARSRIASRPKQGRKQTIAYSSNTRQALTRKQADYVVNRTSPGETRETMRRVLGQPYQIRGNQEIYEVEPGYAYDERIEARKKLVLIYNQQGKLQSKYRP